MINLTIDYSRILISTVICLLVLIATHSVYADDAQEMIKAAGSGDLEKVEGLLAKHTNLSAKNEQGRTALIQAAGSENINAFKIVELFVAAGSEINATDNSGNTATMLAAKSGSLKIVQSLVGNGAKLNQKNNYGSTALDMAGESENYEIVSLLRLNSGAAEALGLFVDLRGKLLTSERFQQAAKTALTRRGWEVTSVEVNTVSGVLSANNKMYKTRFIMLDKDNLLIRFEYGFSADKQNYLHNLKIDFLSALNK